MIWWLRRLSRKLPSGSRVPRDRASILRRGIGTRDRDRPAIVLGIESSCDDTGCGIVDENRNILGQALSSQQATSLRLGGVIPTIAGVIHQQNITGVCEQALRSAGLRLRDVSAVATTVKPGLAHSLKVGLRFGKYLARVGNKPFIPIDHMEAHALTARLTSEVNFPFLVLLVSGGHSILAIAKDVDEFYTLGTTKDNSPGEMIDKVARRLKLHNIPGFEKMSGGQAIELAASRATDVTQFPFKPTMTRIRDCNFSFSGMTSPCMRHIIAEETKHNIQADMIIPDVYNLCAAYQFAVIQHICQRTQRAMLYAEQTKIIPEEARTLVVSGGVASNDTLARALGLVCEDHGYRLVRPPRNLCTDNGVMIAWNGMERWLTNKGVMTDRDEIERVVEDSKAGLGEDWSKKVLYEEIKIKSMKLMQRLF